MYNIPRKKRFGFTGSSTNLKHIKLKEIPMKIPERSEKLKQGLRDMIQYINDNVGNTEEMTIMEIGSWTGVSAEIFAQNFKYVVCVDPWEATEGINTEYNMDDVFKIFWNRIQKYDNIIHIRKTSKEMYDAKLEYIKPTRDSKIDFTNGFDIIYIDGAHDYVNVKQDIELWKGHCKVLAGHDYWPGRFDGVIKAVNEVIGKPDKVFNDTSWIKEI